MSLFKNNDGMYALASLALWQILSPYVEVIL